MALFTFGEGYHNYHHEFQHDYRNGVKPWQWDPTKWLIWILSKLGLTTALRRVPQEKIYSTQARLRDLPACDSFKFEKRREYFVGPDNEPLSVVAMRVSNADRQQTQIPPDRPTKR